MSDILSGSEGNPAVSPLESRSRQTTNVPGSSETTLPAAAKTNAFPGPQVRPQQIKGTWSISIPAAKRGGCGTGLRISFLQSLSGKESRYTNLLDLAIGAAGS